MATEAPLFSLITVTRNAKRQFETLRDDVRRIETRNHEWVIVDGASTDGTVEVIRSSSDVVTRWLSEQDSGIYDAMNKGLNLASGQYVVFFGADDRLYPQALGQMEVWLKAQPVLPDFVVAAVDVGASARRGYRPQRAWLGHRACVTCHSVGMLVKREIMIGIGGFSLEYPLCADGLVIKRLIQGRYAGLESEIVMGRFGLKGVTNTNVARCLAECYLIQLATGENPWLQRLLYGARLVKNAPRLLRARE
jgi:glycosyltransferase involved in cell wall biosynthesis